MAADEEGVVEAQHCALHIRSPPARRASICDAVVQVAADAVVGAVESKRNIEGVEEEDD